jgi:hypothetical protein
MRGDLEASGYRSPQDVALYVEASVPSKFSGCETTIERRLYKALHKLQRLQAARHADGDAPPPVAIDVDVSGVSKDEH